jgi:phage-related protein
MEAKGGNALKAEAKFGSAVYVLDAFKKKSKVGSKTPPRDMELIVKRLKEAEEHHKLSHAPKRKS